MKTDDRTFLWNTIPGQKLEDILLSCNNLTRITVCSAFLSQYGVSVLKKVVSKNRLSVDDVKVYIGRNFTQNQPSELLRELCTFASVKIFDPTLSEGSFHPKLYLLYTQSKRPHIVMGSSNLTKGGLINNVEFNSAWQLLDNEATQVEIGFLNMVEHRSVKVTDELIAQYKEIEPQLKEAGNLQCRAERDVQGIFQDTDLFQRNDYDLAEQFLTFEDYEAFFPRNQGLSLGRVPRRKLIQERFIDLAEELMSTLQARNMNLHLHWSRNHTTSLTHPTIYNSHYVPWLGVRFGKHRDEVMNLIQGAEEDDFIGFQKHACLQFSMYGEGFETSLFHAVARDAIDRPYLHEQIWKAEFSQRLVDALRVFEGQKCCWLIDGRGEFNFESGRAEDFIEFYRDKDSEGYHSKMYFRYEVDDPRISKENIKTTILRDFELFYPVYELVAKRY